MATINYEISTMTPNQVQKEDVYNDAMNQIDNLIKSLEDRIVDLEARVDELENPTTPEE